MWIAAGIVWDTHEAKWDLWWIDLKLDGVIDHKHYSWGTLLAFHVYWQWYSRQNPFPNIVATKLLFCSAKFVYWNTQTLDGRTSIFGVKIPISSHYLSLLVL